MFLATTILIAILKKERSEVESDLQNHPDYGIKRAYPILWKIIKLKPIIQFTIILLTVKASFAAVDVVTTLKLIEYGVPKEKIALLAIPLVPLQLILPFIIARFTAGIIKKLATLLELDPKMVFLPPGPTPMIFYIKAFPYRLILVSGL